MAYKPDSVPRHHDWRRGGDHPSGHTVTGCLKRPTRRLGRATLNRLRGRTFRCGLLDLASGGVCRATPVTRDAGALLPHRFTLTTARVAVCFLWHFPASRLGLPLAITLLCEVRTFLDSAPVLWTGTSRGRPANSSARTRYSLAPLLASGYRRLITGFWLLPNFSNHCLNKKLVRR